MRTVSGRRGQSDAQRLNFLPGLPQTSFFAESIYCLREFV